MKRLLPSGQVVVLYTPSGRGFRRPRITPPYCISQIWRDCRNDECYLVFGDGSVYLYEAPAADASRNLTTANILGEFFNFQMRRPTSVNAPYQRFLGAIPGSAVKIYGFPPYPGTDPGACPTGIDWTLLVWDHFSILNPFGSFVVDPPTGDLGDSGYMAYNLSGTADDGFGQQIGSLVWNGALQESSMNVEITTLVNPAGFLIAYVSVQSGEDVIAYFDCLAAGVGTHHVPFDVPDTMGADASISVFLTCLQGVGMGLSTAIELTATFNNGH